MGIFDKHDNDRYRKEYDSFESREYSAEDYAKIFDNEEKIRAKAAKFKEYSEYVPLLFAMIKDFVKGNYTEVPKGTIASVIGTLLYIFSPIDLVLDAIPVLGLVDDAIILSICVKAVMSDINKYKKWKENQEELADEYKEI